MPRKRTKPRERAVIGWREWLALPELGISAIKAKIDTGARTSSLHAYDVERYRTGGEDRVRFWVHPLQRQTKTAVEADVPLLECRQVRSSSGHLTLRPVIETRVQLLDREWTIELTLADRDQMGFRMLIGRQAIRYRFLVDAGASYCDSSRVPGRSGPAR